MTNIIELIITLIIEAIVKVIFVPSVIEFITKILG